MKKIKLLLIIIISAFCAIAQPGSELQPFIFQTKKIIETLDHLGKPVSRADKKVIKTAVSKGDEKSVEASEKILDKYALFNIETNPEGRVKVKPGISKPVLNQNGWTTFLIKVNNRAGITGKFNILSQQAKRVYDGGERIYGMGGDGKGENVTPGDIKDRWLDLELQNPMGDSLSGLAVEYFIIQLYSRDTGERSATFSFIIVNAIPEYTINISFNCIAAHPIILEILDDDQTPTTAAIIIKDEQGHIYPNQNKRLAPDLFFESQIYRSSGDTIFLPKGKYSIEFKRGAEYIQKSKKFEVKSSTNQNLKINLVRWVNPEKMGYYSGDSHIHASGCSHYTSPTQGIDPKDMMGHIIGEGVNVASVLIWGRGYDYQKQFFEGKDNNLSTKDHLLHYDMEISVFPSGHAGHLVLLRLKDQNYPKTKVLDDWPTYTIPILKWAKAQNAIVGYAHSGLGLEVKSDELPNYELPNFDGIGANEYIVAATQNLVDFISALDTPPVWELNIWYHTLNCGYRTRIVGETDYPCLSDDKVAHGRSYVKIDKELNYNEWTEGLKLGKSYVSEGKSHLMDFKVDDVEAGTQNSELNLLMPSKVKVSARVSAYLNETIDQTIKALDYSRDIWLQKPFWNLERGRIGNTRTVSVELIVNGEVVDKKVILANGSLQDISFETQIDKSSWVALRIFSSSHTNPVFVIVNNKPIRASKKSAEWCMKAVDICWAQKQGQISETHKTEAQKVYEDAKRIYSNIMYESY